MDKHGFIRDILEVKVLILFVMNRVLSPIDEQKIYELCYQDDCLSYFDICTAVPQLVSTGHLEQVPEGYVITDAGRANCAITADTIAYPVMQRAQQAVERFNREIRRDSFIHAEVLPRQNGDFSVVMSLDDEQGNLMTLEVMAPTQRQARQFVKAFHGSADVMFRRVMQLLTDSAAPETSAAPEQPAGD